MMRGEKIIVIDHIYITLVDEAKIATKKETQCETRTRNLSITLDNRPCGGAKIDWELLVWMSMCEVTGENIQSNALTIAPIGLRRLSLVGGCLTLSPIPQPW